MEYTTHYSFLKPQLTDLVAIANLNSNSDSLDTIIYNQNGFYMNLPYYYNTNTKCISDCEPFDGWVNNSWAGTSGTYSADYTNYKVGTAGAKLTTPASLGGGSGIHLVKDLDLTKFQDGSASSTADYIRLVLYIDSTSLANLQNGLWLGFFNDTYPTVTNFIRYNITKASLSSGWNYLSLLKSNFAAIGAGVWSGIKGISLYANSADPTGVVNVTIDAVQLLRVDPISSAFPNPFQRNISGTMTKDFTIKFTTNYTSPFWWVGNEFNKTIVRNLNPESNGTGSTASSLVGQTAYTTTCILSSMEQCYVTNYSNKLVWEKDANNRVFVSINNGNLTLNETASGTDGSAVTLTCALAVGDIVQLTLNMSGAVAQAIAIVNGTSYEVTKTLTVTGSGYLAVANTTTYQATINDVSIANTSNVDHANKADWAANVGNGTWEVIETKTLSTNYAQIDFVDISPNWKALGLLIMKAHSSTSTIRDLYIRYNDKSSGGYYYTITKTTNTATILNSNTATEIQLPTILGGSSSVAGGAQLIISSSLGHYAETIINAFGDGGTYQSVISGMGAAVISGSVPVIKISLIASADAIKSGTTFILMGVK